MGQQGRRLHRHPHRHRRPAGHPARHNWLLTNLAQTWVSNPSTNHGVLLKAANETTPAEHTLFLSSEASEFQLRPQLRITYIEPTAASTYYAPATPQLMTAGGSYTVPVTLTNPTTTTWKAADNVLTYHWALPDGTDQTAGNQVQTALPKDVVPGDSVTVNATIKAPTPADPGGTRLAYVPTWDLYNKTTAAYLSASAGIPGLALKVGVERPTSDELGLERFYQYVGHDTGAGSSALVNQHAGNLVWSYNPFANPSRGPATFVRLTYNSLDTSASSMGFGWSLSAASLMRLGTALDFHPPGQDWPTTIG